MCYLVNDKEATENSFIFFRFQKNGIHKYVMDAAINKG